MSKFRDLADGESTEMKGSAAKPYVLKNIGGVYSCTCIAWKMQSLPIEQRTCKHLKKLRGEEAEAERVGNAVPPPKKSKEEKEKDKPPLLLAEKWDNELDLAGWWISEKLDGVRSYWDGKRLISRLGNPQIPPDWFIQNFPETPLDGELWIDRKTFNRVNGIAKRKDKKDEVWKDVKYVVFDAPGIDEPFEKRIDWLAKFFKKNKEQHLLFHEHIECKGIDHLRKELVRVEELGGEGLMLREPASKYEIGRSTTLLKVKSFHDAEATVVAHVPGKGRHKGRLGAVEVELTNGTRFSVGSGFTDKQREAPPAIGTVITFRYQELTPDGKPRFPTFVRVTTDK